MHCSHHPLTDILEATWKRSDLSHQPKTTMSATPSSIPPKSHPEFNLQPFLSASFSPVDYLNATLPPSTPATPKSPAPSLADLASQTQSHISTLTAQSTRLSTALTALTDEILRVSPRLAYEVELLRGETRSLVDSLSQPGDLYSAISKFVPAAQDSAPEQSADATSTASLQIPAPDDPPIKALRILLRVRALLTTVSQIFSLALSWPFPPSLLASPSLISVSAPTDPTLEAKGQVACARLRQEVIDMIADHDAHGDVEDGITKAEERISELRDCVGVWKGTGEEKARAKFVDGLETIVTEEKKRRVRKNGEEKENSSKTGRQDGEATASTTIGAKSGGVEAGGGPGFLRRLRDEIYME